MMTARIRAASAMFLGLSCAGAGCEAVYGELRRPNPAYCYEDDDCGSRVCQRDAADAQPHSCVAEGSIFYVDGEGCEESAQEGTQEHPFCDVQTAVERGDRPYVRVLGRAAGGKPYPAVRITALKVPQLTIVGTGREVDDVQKPAQALLRQVCVEVDAGVRLRDLSISTGAESASPTCRHDDQDGVICDQANGLTLTRVWLYYNLKALLATEGCKGVVLDQVGVLNNKLWGPCLLDRTTLTVQNSLFLGNETPLGIDKDVEAKISYSTFVSNVNTMGCASPRRLQMVNSIYWKNGTNAINVACNLEAQGLVLKDPGVDEDTGRLEDGEGSRACCIDKAVPGEPVPPVDYFGEKRPQGAGADIGCSEGG